MRGTDGVPDTAATGTILLMAAERGGSRRLAVALRRRGLGVLEPESPGGALGLARGARPSVAALDLRCTGVMFVVDRISADDRCGRPAVALLVPRGVTPVPSIVPAHGVEVVEWDPEDPDGAAQRLAALAEHQRELRASSPLTGLPGNGAIRAELEDRFAAGSPTALLYVDLDAFKPYNDRYGFLRGDGVLRLVASLLVAEARRHPGSFVGHIGGDDFVLLVAPEAAEAVAWRIASSFDLIAPHLYDPADAARGRLLGRDRLGRRCRWPLLSLSIGVARSDQRDVRDALELTDIATEMKRVAKRTRGSAVAVDQRTSQDPGVRWRLRALATLARPSLRRVGSAVAAVLLAAVLFVPAGGAIALAKPGEPLWPATRLMQDVRFALAGPDSSVSLRFELASTHFADAVSAFGAGDDRRAAAALAAYRHRYGQAVTLLDEVEWPSRQRRLAQISAAGDRQAAVLAGLVESRCEPVAGGVDACVELRAALASVARTPDPAPPGATGEGSPGAPHGDDQRGDAVGRGGEQGVGGGSGDAAGNGATPPGGDAPASGPPTTPGGGGSPAADGGTPGDGEAPGMGSETPGDASETPGDASETPGAGGATPADGGATPPGDGEVTPGDRGEPGDGSWTPGDGGVTPGDRGEPGGGAWTPGDGGVTPWDRGQPGGGGGTPGDDGATPGAAGGTPWAPDGARGGGTGAGGGGPAGPAPTPTGPPTRASTPTTPATAMPPATGGPEGRDPGAAGRGRAGQDGWDDPPPRDAPASPAPRPGPQRLQGPAPGGAASDEPPASRGSHLPPAARPGPSSPGTPPGAAPPTGSSGPPSDRPERAPDAGPSAPLTGTPPTPADPDGGATPGGEPPAGDGE